jgi:hypothetical protein
MKTDEAPVDTRKQAIARTGRRGADAAAGPLSFGLADSFERPGSLPGLKTLTERSHQDNALCSGASYCKCQTRGLSLPKANAAANLPM